MKYKPQKFEGNPVENIVGMLKQKPQQPVTVGFLDFCSTQFQLMGLTCDTYDEVLEMLEYLADFGTFYMYEKNEEPYIVAKDEYK